MELSKFKERYPLFLKLMKEKGYYSGYIEKYEGIVRLILREGEDDSISTYEDFYFFMVEHHNYTKGTCYEYKTLVGQLKFFVEEGVFPGEVGKKSGFLRRKSYNLLFPDFKGLIDNYLDIERKRDKLKDSTIERVASCTSAFLLRIQQTGITTLSGIKSVQTVYQALSESQKKQGCYSVAKLVTTVLKTCMHLYPDGECNRVFGMIPEFPRRTRIYDHLQPEENRLLAFSLDDENNKLTYRCKAIGKLAYYTGMRRIDIANLRFENISFEMEEIRFVQQKTGLEVCLPLRPVAGNAVYEYIVNERPKCDLDYIFITAVAPFIQLSPAGVSNDFEKIFKEIDLRQNKGRRRGSHLFRHAFTGCSVCMMLYSHFGNLVPELLPFAICFVEAS
jgi:integrase